MKAFFRSRYVVAITGRLIWFWMIMTAATTRWHVEGEADVQDDWASCQGAILACWHRGVILLPSGWMRHVRRWPGKPPKLAMFVSMSRDGLHTTRACELLGLDIIKGSSANKKKINKDKGGVQAIFDATRRLKENGVVCLTLDGPRGPAEVAGLGAIKMAQHAGSAILPYAISASPVVRIKTWDRLMLPIPFARGAIVFGPMLYATRHDDPEALRLELQRRMEIATARADAIVGLRPTPPQHYSPAQ